MHAQSYILTPKRTTVEARRRERLARALSEPGSPQPHRSADPTPDTSVAVRMLTTADASELERLVQLEGREAPAGRLLGGEVGGRLVAVVSIDSSGVLADPFSRSADAVELLKLRLRQLGGTRRPRPFGRRRRKPGRRPATLAGSPPGAGGRLLRL